MKKTTWLLLAISVVAMLLVAGCTPTTPTPTVSPSPTATATTPPTDKECPKVVSTVVTKLYANDPTKDPNFQIKITFNENISSGCLENLSKWTVTVTNPGRQDADGKIAATIDDIIVGEKTVTIKARVEESVKYAVSYIIPGTTGDSLGIGMNYFIVPFYGLICDETDAKAYAGNYKKSDYLKDKIILESDVTAPTTYDLVSWTLSDCAVADDLGNSCCNFSGSGCCMQLLW